MANETKQFLYVKTAGAFEANKSEFLENGKYYDVIAFVKETNEIWTHGQAWGFGSEKAEALQQLIEEVEGKNADKKDGLLSRVSAIEALIGNVDGEDGDTDDIINKLTEIIEWFKDVKETEDGAVLLQQVAANTKEIGTKATDAVGDEDSEDYKPAQEATGLYKYIDDKIQTTAEGAVYTEGDHKSFTVGSIVYDLTINNETNKISIEPYTKLGVTVSPGNTTLEYDDTTTSRALTATITGSSASTATITWSGGASGSATTATQSWTKNTADTATVKVEDGRSSATASTKVSYSQAVAVYKSADADLATLVDDSKAWLTGVDHATLSTAAASNKSLTLAAGDYIYFACTGTPKNFYISNTTSKAPLAGGVINTGKTFTAYSKNLGYKLYRSKDAQPAGTYRFDVD